MKKANLTIVIGIIMATIVMLAFVKFTTISVFILLIPYLFFIGFFIWMRSYILKQIEVIQNQIDNIN